MVKKVSTTNKYGATPKKRQMFDTCDPPVNIEISTPARRFSTEESAMSHGRPKTSRGVANPSIDQWTDYVSPTKNYKASDVKLKSMNEERLGLIGWWLLGLALSDRN